MKNKKKTYLLLLVVLAIWGILGFRIIATLGPSEEVQSPTKTVALEQPLTLKKRDTFSINANYRDPFLGTLPKTKKKAKTPKKKSPIAPKRSIAYHGSVAQNGSKSRLFFVWVDNQQYIFEKGKSIDGVTVVSGTKERIKVTYAGHTETHILKE
ncbi:hypothetical protein [Flagellimonas meridianipacifica]|uniref:Type II secretion system protein GspC N-terminal domain-containing protein n=1 Tax=Flagellimonas meridianipacifica TaxID=1080225 RepID=A0A2T0MHZ1_9FLAO|nr:hypothetical protein [Allomuricauda pacifica]PRX57191.1 hypothetical protein CLV81_1194 [Allomuricauda pacifica]